MNIDPEVLRRWNDTARDLGNAYQSYALARMSREIDALLHAHDAAERAKEMIPCPNPECRGVPPLCPQCHGLGMIRKHSQITTPPDAAKGEVCECGHDAFSHDQPELNKGECFCCDCTAYRAAPGEGAE
jgi:hypothetical protein